MADTPGLNNDKVVIAETCLIAIMGLFEAHSQKFTNRHGLTKKMIQHIADGSGHVPGTLDCNRSLLVVMSYIPCGWAVLQCRHCSKPFRAADDCHTCEVHDDYRGHYSIPNQGASTAGRVHKPLLSPFTRGSRCVIMAGMSR